jgi:hypothetical protein
MRTSVEGRDGRPLQDCRDAADDDELDALVVKEGEELSEPRDGGHRGASRRPRRTIAALAVVPPE